MNSAKSYTQLSQSIFVHHGCCNVGIVRAGERALLIDTGKAMCKPRLRHWALPPSSRSSLPIITAIGRLGWQYGYSHHADWRTGCRTALVRGGRTLLHDPKMRWHLYNVHPHNLMLAESVPVHAAYDEGDQIRWGDVTITVFSTPGHTDGSVSYLVDTGEERVIFCGDLIYAAGQLWELYSLQKGNGRVTDYHGFWVIAIECCRAWIG